MQPLVVQGTVRPQPRSSSIAGYSIRISFNEVIDFDTTGDRGDKADQLTVPVSGSNRLPEDGRFEMALGGQGTPTGHARIVVTSPNGTDVSNQLVPIDHLSKPVDISVVTVDRFEIEPSDDPTLGARARISGRVIDERGRKVAAEFPVVIWGVDRPTDTDDDGEESPARPLVISRTQLDGHFTADWVSDRLTRAFGRVSGGPPITVRLDENDRLVRDIVLVIDVDELVDDGEAADCCAEVAPRAPDPADLTANPNAFSQDLGGSCVDLTTPNRAVEEFSYFMAVRTTEPKVKGVTLGVRRAVPDDLLVDLLGVSLASEAIGTNRFSTNRSLPNQSLILDVDAARQLVRTDQPPTVNQIARAAWLSELGFTRGLIDAGLRNTTGRVQLDADNPIDWDDTPTIHLAIEVAHGHLLQYREVWRSDGYSLGDLLYSLPLAPNQRRQVAVLDWDRRAVSASEERLEFEEQLDALLARDRDIQEIVGSELHEETNAGSRNTTWGAAGGIGAGFIGSGFGIFGGVAGGGGGSDSTSWQNSARTFSADSVQNLRDRVAQRSSAVRSQRSSVVQSVAQGESLRAETEVVANYNRCHAITIEYFEVLRHLLVTHELADVQECLFVPLPITAFNRAKALRWREPLSRYLRDRGLRRGFAAIERMADNWEGWDFPESRYSEEAPEVLEGELRISFGLPRPRDDEDGKFQIDMWKPFSPFLRVDALEIFTAKLNDKVARERDRIFRQEIAPGIAEELIQRLRFAYVTADGGEVEVPMDATLVSRYSENRPLYVTLNPAGEVPGVPREDISHVKIWYEGDPLSPDAQVIVHSGKMRYRAPHITALLFKDARILDDIRGGDPVVIPSPMSRRELRNPRDEDRELADRLVAHLNEHLEYYHQAIWVNLDAQRRYMLLDAVLVPGLDGKSIASVCTNELIGIVGNSLVLPVAPGQRLDPTLAGLDNGDGEQRVELLEAYATPPSPPLRVSVPTRGVYAEAVSGECNACEAIDDTRYWRWSVDGLLAPPEIAPVSTGSLATDEPDLTPTPLPSPLVSIQNAPDVPDPFGLGPAFELLSKPELFRDITGLEGTQKNAGAAFEASLSAASALGGEAAKLASQQELGRNAERMLDRINQARGDGLLTQAKAQELAGSALRGLIGEPRPKEKSPTKDKTIEKVLDKASQSDKAHIKVSTSSETVEVSFEDDAPKVGAAAIPVVVDRDEFVDQPVIVEPLLPADISSFVVDDLAGLRFLTTAAVVAELERLGFVRPHPADPTRFQVKRRLRIVHPADPATPTEVSGSGRLPVVFIVHGHHREWSSAGETRNHEGYTYLQQELAEHGIVSVSVDTNAANFFGSLIEMRADMVLGAMDTMRALDGDPTSRFEDRLDLDKVGLVGHSRGGDAVVRVADMNRSRTTDKFGIQAVCALAPTDFTGTGPAPGSIHVVSPNESPFFAVVYGGLDGDVSGRRGAEAFTGTGFRHYDRAETDKAMVFIDHCNHNRFNTVWTADGDDSDMHPDDVAAGGRLLSPTDHQELAKQYIGGLFRWRLQAENAQQGLFDGTRSNTRGAGAAVQWSFGADIQKIDDMQDPTKVRTVNNAFIDPLADFTVNGRDLGDETNHQTTVLGLEPLAPGSPDVGYAVDLPPAHRDWTNFDAFTFRVGADFDLTTAATIAGGRLPEFQIIITDTADQVAVVSSVDVTTPLAPRRPVFHLVTGPAENCTALRLETLTIPVGSLTGIDRTSVASVSIVPATSFPTHVFFDSLQLVRK